MDNSESLVGLFVSVFHLLLARPVMLPLLLHMAQCTGCVLAAT